jgi:hypothetical protein
MKTLLA